MRTTLPCPAVALSGAPPLHSRGPLEEELQQLSVGGSLGIEDDLDRLRVPVMVAVGRNDAVTERGLAISG
jgi:hypothetical protein